MTFFEYLGFVYSQRPQQGLGTEDKKKYHELSVKPLGVNGQSPSW